MSAKIILHPSTTGYCKECIYHTKKIVYDNNPIDKMCLANTAVKTDINGNIQPVKTDDPRKRIDGTMALLDAYVVLRDKYDDYMSMI